MCLIMFLVVMRKDLTMQAMLTTQQQQQLYFSLVLLNAWENTVHLQLGVIFWENSQKIELQIL